MRSFVAIALCGALGAAAGGPVQAQDLQDSLGRLLQGFQGGQQQQQQDQRGGPRRGDDRRPVYDEAGDPRERMRMLDEADRRLDAQQRQIDEDRRRIEQERRRLSR